MFSRWTLFQCITLTFLIVVMFLTELLRSNQLIVISSNQSSYILPILFPIIFIAVVIGSISLIILFQSKKVNSLFINQIWRKQYIYIIVILLFSTFILMILFVYTPWAEWIDTVRILFYIQSVYFLSLFYTLVLSLVYKLSTNSYTDEKVIFLTFNWTLALLILLIFIIPGF